MSPVHGLAVVFGLGLPLVARAAAPPADTNAIESLTPDRARALAADSKGEELTIDVCPMGQSQAGGLQRVRVTRSRGLSLNGLKALDAETARALAGFAGETLQLGGLTTLPADAARELATFQGRYLLLDGLTALPADSAAAVAAFEGRGLHLDGLTTLDAATATALAKFPGLRLRLGGLTALDAEAARALARFGGASLHLDRLQSLDADSARGLTACRCLRMHLGGLADLTAIEGPASAEIVRLLATSLAAEDGRAAFHGLAALSPAAAEALAADPRWDGRLPGLTAFTAPDSVAVAKALASRKGTLALPNLKKISPKTLFALIEKEDAEIPLIETLELIAEPDGGPTDDFVIPDGFHEWQMKRQQGN